MRLRLPLSCFALLLAASPALARNAMLFCKCICGDSSEIIAINHHDISPNELSMSRLFARLPLPIPQEEDDDDHEQDNEAETDEGDGDDEEDKEEEEEDPNREMTCNDCTRQFCLDQNIPACELLQDHDVVTQCFQRDSSKDQAIILLFMVTTASLLSWAVVRPWIAKIRQSKLNSRIRSAYAPVPPGE